MRTDYTLQEIEQFISKSRLLVSAEYVYSYWYAKGWKTQKGEPVKTLSALVHVANSAFVTEYKKKHGIDKYNADLDQMKSQRTSICQKPKISFNPDHTPVEDEAYYQYETEWLQIRDRMIQLEEKLRDELNKKFSIKKDEIQWLKEYFQPSSN